jgi:NADH dehydrogenase [ubiquinone] 1 alpha subcomplex assembly factor 7
VSTIKKILLDQAVEKGGLSIAQYMEICLFDPEYGYYRTQPVFGKDGDFVTAPEISQMFGEIIGLWLAQCWIEQDRPESFTLLELGPGRGTLMADILRATAKVAGFHDAMQITLIEASEQLRALQKQALTNSYVSWLDDISQLPEQPAFFIANEFFDALPVHQFQRHDNQWFERQVISAKGELCLDVCAHPSQLTQLQNRLTDTSDKDIVEINLKGKKIALALGALIETFGGSGLIIDYGDWVSLGDTLQAVQGQEPVDIFAAPGQSDLSSHVDFAALVNDLACKHSRLTPQGLFLERLEITQRANILAEYLTDDALKMHIAAHRRLTHPDEMGSLFKVLSFYPTYTPIPAGF